MKKLMLSLAVLLMTAFAASAQVSVSVQAGFASETATLLTGSGDTKSKASDAMGGFYLGAMGSYELMPNVAVNAGLRYKYNGSSSEDELFGIEFETDEITMTLELPVRASYLVDLGEIGVFAYAGPVFELGLVNKTVTEVGDNVTETTNYGEDGVIRRFDIRLGGGVGVVYESIYFNCGYDFGLLNRTTLSDASYHTQGLKVGLGFVF